MLSDKEIKQIREELENCKNPLFFFHDDPDGLCSFLLLYRYVKEGHGIVFKAKPGLGVNFVRKVEEYMPDKIFILDIPIVDQEFIDKVKVPIVWIDHHDSDLENLSSYVTRFNPIYSEEKSNEPVTYLSYRITNRKEDSWIALMGCLSDHYLPDFADEFARENSDLWMKQKTNK